MTATEAEVLYAEERRLFERSADWELRNIRTALTTFPWMNDARQEARLRAVKDLLRERKARR